MPILLQKLELEKRNNSLIKKLAKKIFIISLFFGPFIGFQLYRAFTIYDGLLTLSFSLLIITIDDIIFPDKIILIFALFFLLSSFYSTFRSHHPIEAFLSSAQFFFIFFCHLPITSYYFQNIKVQKKFLTIINFSLATIVILSFWSIYSSPTLPNRLQIIFHGPNHLGHMIVITFPFLLVLLKRNSSTVFMTVEYVLIFLLFVILLFSKSRQSWVAFIGMLVTYIALTRGVNINIFSLIKKIMIYSFAIFILGLVSYYLIFPEPIVARIDQSLYWNSPEVQDRIKLLQSGIRAVPDYFIIGTGLDNFDYVADHYKVDSKFTPDALKVHNVYLNNLLQVGIVGTLSLIFIFLRSLQIAHKKLKFLHHETISYQLLVASVASFIGLIVISLFITNVIRRFYWLPVGIILSLKFREKEN